LRCPEDSPLRLVACYQLRGLRPRAVWPAAASSGEAREEAHPMPRRGRGETGRRKGLKIPRLRPYGFDSRRPHQWPRPHAGTPSCAKRLTAAAQGHRHPCRLQKVKRRLPKRPAAHGSTRYFLSASYLTWAGNSLTSCRFAQNGLTPSAARLLRSDSPRARRLPAST
jgi:hypothetical protein